MISKIIQQRQRRVDTAAVVRKSDRVDDESAFASFYVTLVLIQRKTRSRRGKTCVVMRVDGMMELGW